MRPSGTGSRVDATSAEPTRVAGPPGGTRSRSRENRGLRIDKYLKVSRLAKRRSEAHEALVNGRIAKDGRPLKPGYDVKVGDVLELHYARKFLTVRILHVPLKVTPALRTLVMYEVVSERRDEPADWLG